MPLGAHLVDEAHHQRLRGSSSPAKKVVAAFRIATSSRSRRFSTFKRLISGCSSLVCPSRSPASISACTLTFNEVGKVSKAVTGSTTQTNVYNPDGSLLLRVSSAEGAALILGDTTLTQPAGSTVTSAVRTYSAAGGKPIAERSATSGTPGTTLTWTFSTLDGTVDTQTNAKTGTTTRQYRDPFGVPIGGASGVWGDGTGFLGKPATASSKLTTVGARTYDPVLGKFTSADPITDPNNPQQNIGYAYASNNPITLSDPSGLRPLGACDDAPRIASNQHR